MPDSVSAVKKEVRKNSLGFAGSAVWNVTTIQIAELLELKVASAKMASVPYKLLFYTRIKGMTGPMSPGNVAGIINKYADEIRGEHPNLPEHLHCHMFRCTREPDYTEMV